MVKHTDLVKLLLGVTIFLTSTVRASEIVSSGSSCHAITPAQATKMEWRAQGMVNTDTRNDWWVNCPFSRQRGFSEQVLRLRVYNEGSSTNTISCNFREMNSGSRVQGAEKSTSVPSGQARTLEWKVFPTKGESVFNAACKLPDGIQIESVISRVGSCDEKSVQGGWVVAAGYGYDGFELAVVELDGAGGVDGRAIDSADLDSDIYGEYEVDSVCAVTINATVADNGTSLRFIGFLTSPRDSITGIGINRQTGYVWDAVMSRVATFNEIDSGVGTANLDSPQKSALKKGPSERRIEALKMYLKD